MMFRNRQSSQKPPDELFERFRLSFPDVTSTAGDSPTSHMNGLQDSALNPVSRFGHEDLDPTPRAAAEPFRFTPSLLDPSSAAFAAFANQPPGYYTPTPGNHQTTSYPEAHTDLPTPNIGIGIGPPIANSAPTSLLNSASAYPPQAINPQHFNNYHPFLVPQIHQSYALHSFDAPASPKGSPMELSGREEEMQGCKPMFSHGLDGDEDRQMMHHPAVEHFRFHVTLTAPTAMVRHPDEIPVTYLNKGQAYTMNVVDTSPPASYSGVVRYRTFVRISFQDEGQRQRAAVCWQLWKEGRGTNEAHQRGGKLQAVEFVPASSTVEDERNRGRMNIDTASFDGFSVIWAPVPGTFETAISVRFNFLSTDFSHSKGVKGIPVRLCAKTELISSGSPRSPDEQSEVCFCKVKLFRDHGAERKLANDILHVKKTMDKLRQQADGPDESSGNGKKRKDSAVMNKSSTMEGKPGKAAKHKRTWSISSANSTGGVKVNEDDIILKLQTLQDMFTSTRPISILYLRGDEVDDPDLHPVHLPGEIPEGIDESWIRRPSVASMMSSASASSFVSPTPSSVSLSSQHDYPSNDRPDMSDNFRSLNQRYSLPSSEVTKVKTSNDAGVLAGWIEAIGIDPIYVPPVDRSPKAVMCVYALNTMAPPGIEQNYYKAVYLHERTEGTLSSQIAMKCGVDYSQIRRVIRVDARGLHSIVDDDVVREMKEGQDIKVQFLDMSNAMLSPPQTDWAPDMETESKDMFSKGWEMRLCF